jgi:hypothetical protein
VSKSNSVGQDINTTFRSFSVFLLHNCCSSVGHDSSTAGNIWYMYQKAYKNKGQIVLSYGHHFQLLLHPSRQHCEETIKI